MDTKHKHQTQLKRPPLPRPLVIKLTKRMLERTARYVQ